MEQTVKVQVDKTLDIPDDSDLGKLLLTLRTLNITHKVIVSQIANEHIIVSILDGRKVFRTKDKTREEFQSNKIWILFDSNTFKKIDTTPIEDSWSNGLDIKAIFQQPI